MDKMDLSVVFDLHKDARGFRPSQEWMNTFAASDYLDQKSVIDGLAEEVVESIEIEERRDAQKYRLFVQSFDQIAEQFGVDINTAIRWDMDRAGIDRTSKQDIEAYLFWDAGLSFKMIDLMVPQFIQQEEVDT